jgi:hypothetical protein
LRQRAVAAVLGAVAAATAIGAWTVSAQASTAPAAVVEQRFAADSGDACRYGVTKGSLFWSLGPWVAPSTVGVDAVLVDRPMAGEPATCRDDRRFSVVTLTAFAGNVAVAERRVRADNQVVDYEFRLVNDTSLAPIDRVAVVVCRHPIETGVPGYCGTRQEFRRPVN